MAHGVDAVKPGGSVMARLWAAGGATKLSARAPAGNSTTTSASTSRTFDIRASLRPCRRLVLPARGGRPRIAAARSGNMQKTVRRPSPALIIALVALFVALGGPAQARRLINGHDIRKGTVTSRQVKDHSLTTGDLRPSAVRSLRTTP